MTNVKKRKFLGAILTFFIINVMAPIIIAENSEGSPTTSEQDAPITGTAIESSSGSTYIIGPLGFYMDHLDQFRAQLGVNADLDGWSDVIETYFLPLNLRLIIMWVPGWASGTLHANTTTANIIFSSSFDLFLSACDKYAVSVIFQWPKGWSFTMNGGWDADVFAQFPELAGLHKNGTAYDPLESSGDTNWAMIDNPLYFLQLKEDLKQLYAYYGHHKSWVGLGQFKGDYQYYAGKGEDARDIFQTYSLRNYVNSKYFNQIVDVNTGLHRVDQTECLLHDMFFDRSVVLEYGQWLGIVSYWFSGVYGGTGDAGHVAAFKFQAPENMEGFKLVWYGRAKGAPPDPLTIELYRNQGPYGSGEQPADLGNPLESQLAPVSGEGWQPAVSFNTRLAKGDYYWAVFQTSGGDENNCYQPYYRNFKRDESTFKYSYKGYTTNWWSFRGSAVLKVQDEGGNDARIYPFQRQVIKTTSSSGLTQTFITPNREISFNTVTFLFSDRISDQGESTVEIKDSANTVIASNVFTQRSLKGFPYNGFGMIPLDQRITLQPNSQYSITVRTPNNRGWQWHQIITDPASEGFQNQNATFIFKLLDIDIAIENFMHVGGSQLLEALGRETGTAGITDIEWYASGFVPSQNASLSQVSLYMSEIYGSPSSLVVSLYSGDDTKPVTELESRTITPSLGWNDVVSWTHQITAGHHYWIVLRSSTGAGYRPARIVNPHIFINRRSTDGGSSWGYQADVGDLCLQIVTSHERLGITVEGRLSSEIPVTDKKWISQSFSPTTDITTKGILVYVNKPENDPGSDLIIEIRTDDNDQPSSTILTWGKISYTKQSVHGLFPVDFYLPVELTAGKKYWAVLRTPRFFQDPNYAPTLEAPFYYFRNPEETFGGATYGAKYSTDEGSSWNKPNGKEGDIIFAIVRAKSAGAKSLQDLVDNDLNPYHCFSSPDPPEPLRGWNTYLNLQVDKIAVRTMEWLKGISGRKWIYITPNNYRIAKEAGGQRYVYTAEWTTGPLPPAGPPEDKLIAWRSEVKIQSILRQGGLGFWPGGSLGHTWDNTGAITADQIGLDYRLTLPLSARSVHVFDMDPRHIMELDESDSGHATHGDLQLWSKYFGQIMSRMRYHGGYFGTEKGACKALFIGDEDISIVPQFFTPAVDVTLEGFKDFQGDLNLTKYGDFTQFDIIVGFAGRPNIGSLEPNAQERIKSFVLNGGGLVCFNGYPVWATEIFAGATEIDTDHVINSPYATSDFIDSRPQISVSSYGPGRGVIVNLKKSWDDVGMSDPSPWWPFGGAPRDSILVLTTNAMFFAAGRESMLPTWWYPQYKDFQPWHQQVWYSINGRPSHVLLWLTNINETTNFEIHLNANFYGIDSEGWVAVDVASWEVVARGSGTDIKIATEIPAQSWKPIYIMNATSDLQALYSNIFVEGQSISPGEVHFTLQGPHKQTSWLMVSSQNQPTGVNVNNTGTLQKLPLNDLLFTSTSSGWSYDSTNQMVYIKFVPTSSVDVTIFVSTEGLPALLVDVTLDPSTTTSEGEVSIHVYVHATGPTEPINGAYVQLTSDNGGNFSSSNNFTDSNGDFSSTFKAPNVSQQTTVRITATALKGGYVDGLGFVDLTVLPAGSWATEIPWVPIALIAFAGISVVTGLVVFFRRKSRHKFN